jgi:AraC family transcriptional regulator
MNKEHRVDLRSDLVLVPERACVGTMSYDSELRGSPNFTVLLNIYHTDTPCVGSAEHAAIKDRRNALAFLPTGADVSDWSRLRKLGTFIGVYFAARMEERVPEQPVTYPPMIIFEDRMLRAILMAIGCILRKGACVDGYFESLGALLVYELNRVYHERSHSTVQNSGLAPRETQRVCQYIEENLSGKIMVVDLANLVGLSSFHFIRAFKKSTGMPPHQLIMRRRVERAKEMLADNRISVTEVASGSGFNGLTQLTRVFRQLVGVTPTTFRRDVR